MVHFVLGQPDAGQRAGRALHQRRGRSIKGSDNLAGVRDPAVDTLVAAAAAAAADRDELVAAARALDRVLRHGWYLVPHFHAPTHRVAYRNTLAHPAELPLYYGADTWMLKTWWANGRDDRLHRSSASR